MVKFGRSLNQTRRPLSQTTDQTSRQLIKIPPRPVLDQEILSTACCAPRSCTECARGVCHGHRLRHCSRAARRRRSISRAHPMRAHIVRSRGQVAVHGRTPAVAAHMPPAVLLVIDLRIGTAAGCCCCCCSSLLLPHSVKPAAQRGVQKSRGFVPPEAERIQAHRPELDGCTRLTETRATGHVRRHGTGMCARPLVKTTKKRRI